MGRAFVKANYNLKVMAILVFACYEVNQAVVTSIQFPNVQAVARDISPSLTTQTRLITHAKCKLPECLVKRQKCSYNYYETSTDDYLQ